MQVARTVILVVAAGISAAGQYGIVYFDNPLLKLLSAFVCLVGGLSFAKYLVARVAFLDEGLPYYDLSGGWGICHKIFMVSFAVVTMGLAAMNEIAPLQIIDLFCFIGILIRAVNWLGTDPGAFGIPRARVAPA